MKVALIGATGFVGSYILTEALNRGHQVTALVRHPEKLFQHPSLKGLKIDIFNHAQLSQAIQNHDAIITAFNTFNQGLPSSKALDLQIAGTKLIINAAKSANLRLLVVGGAGSLQVAPTLQLADTPEFPSEYKSMAHSMSEVLSVLKSESSLDWTFLSPSALLQPGERTGNFRLGKDQLLVNEKGESKISTQDYAYAMINELENPQYKQHRFTVGY